MDDADAVGQVRDLGEDVARHEDGDARSSASERSSSRTSTIPAGSSPFAGSSSISTSGACSSARASDRRCLLPSDSCPARRSAYGPSRSRSIDSATAVRGAPVSRRWISRFSRTVRFGYARRALHEEADPREPALVALPHCAGRARSPRPKLGRMRPSSIRIVVVLPGAVPAEKPVDLAAPDVEAERRRPR